MLFSSYTFLLLFLPITWGFYRQLQRRQGRRGAIAWLVLASLVYFGWWNPKYLLLLGVSIGVNFLVGILLRSSRPPKMRRLMLIAGIGFNLCLLGFYKYADFFVESLGSAFGTGWDLGTIVLPIAISFFTFQQVAYLVDAHRNLTHEYSFIDYVLFVTFFPQLIAGPIVHHAEMLPQFSSGDGARPNSTDLVVGLTIFSLGLAKKVLLADSLAPQATPVFEAAQAGLTPTVIDAWIASLSYSLQLYFDFSGYSDMALGLGRMFGIVLPLNFSSPYKSASIVEFWRRWHLTLSRFLRDYLYIPIGGSRKGRSRRYVNLMATMVLGGLWHGAGWTFVFWGTLHGVYLVLNHAWASLGQRLGVLSRWGGRSRRLAAVGLTFLATVVAWVFFRAESFGAAFRILTAMAGSGGDGPVASPLLVAGFWLVLLLPAVFLLPNTQEIMSDYQPALDFVPGRTTVTRELRFSIGTRWALLVGILLIISIAAMSRTSEFIYYQF
ncbi:MAG: alginate O-acetyltransferase complex protein AlgI [Planctomycetota bacterium]